MKNENYETYFVAQKLLNINSLEEVYLYDKQLRNSLIKRCKNDECVEGNFWCLNKNGKLTKDVVLFSRIVKDDERNPNTEYDSVFSKDNNMLCLCGYNQDEIDILLNCYDYRYQEHVYENRYKNAKLFVFRSAVAELFAAYNVNLLNELKFLHFSAVCIDDNNSLVGMTTSQGCKYSNLYYGFTNNSIIYSNSYEILNDYCTKICKLDYFEYVVDGQLYKLDTNNYKNKTGAVLRYNYIIKDGL